jgi:hypothetical protein
VSATYPFAGPIGAARAWARSTRGRAAIAGAAPWLVFAVALIVRADFVDDHPLHRYLVDDMAFYDARASHLLDGASAARDTFTPAGYPMLVALVFRVFGRDYAVIGALHAALGAATCAIASGIAARASRSAASGLAAGLALALYPPLVLYTGLLMTETVFTFLLVASAAALLRATTTTRRARAFAIASGLALGVAATVRPNALVALPFVGLFALSLRRSGARRAAREVALSIAVALAPIAAMSAYDTALAGRPTLLATNGGINLFLGVCGCRGVRMPPGDGVRMASGAHNRRRFTEIVDVDHGPRDERAFVAEALARAEDRPTFVALEALRKIGDGLALDVDPRGDPRSSPYWPGWMGHDDALRASARALLWLALLPAAIFTALRARRPRHVIEARTLRLVALLFASCLVTLAVFLGDARLRLPFDPLIFAVAAAAWTTAVRAALRRREAVA